MYSLAVLQKIDLFALKFYLEESTPINHSWRQKTRDIGIANDEDPTLCVPSF